MGTSSSKHEGGVKNDQKPRFDPLLGPAGGGPDPLAALEAELAAAAALEADQEMEMQMLEQEMELEMEAADLEDLDDEGDEEEIDPDELAELEGELAELEEELQSEQLDEGPDSEASASGAGTRHQASSADSDLTRTGSDLMAGQHGQHDRHGQHDDVDGPGLESSSVSGSCIEGDEAGAAQVPDPSRGGTGTSSTTATVSAPAAAGIATGLAVSGSEEGSGGVINQVTSLPPSPTTTATTTAAAAAGMDPDADELDQLRAEMGL